MPLENNAFQGNASKPFNNLPISIRNCNSFSIFSKLVKQCFNQQGQVIISLLLNELKINCFKNVVIIGKGEGVEGQR